MMTLLVALFLVVIALSVGIWAGRRRGWVIGIASGTGILATGILGYIAVIALSLPM
jgi:hypothetical protein